MLVLLLISYIYLPLNILNILALNILANDKCKQCDEIEKELVNIRDDLVESLGSWVVKSMNSQLVRLYDPTKEPAIVFFRHGVPLLYEGKNFIY